MAIPVTKNSGVAAICNAKQTQPSFDTTPPKITSFVPPTIGDWSSVIQAILQLQWALIPIVNPPPINNIKLIAPVRPLGGGLLGGGGAVGGGGGGGGSNQGQGGQKSPTQTPNQNKTNPNKVQWQQTNKVTELVKIVNPDDDTQYVIVKRTVSQTFKNPATGETLTISNPDG